MMESPENKNSDINGLDNTGKDNLNEIKLETKPIQPSSNSAADDSEAIDDDLNDDYNDIDLSDIVPSTIDPSIILDHPVQLVGGTESYKEIINVCSSNAQAIKKTITDALSSRDNVVIAEVDEASELEASLNKKIADFNNAVNGCFEATACDLVSPENSSEDNVLTENIEDTDSKEKSNNRVTSEEIQDDSEVENSENSSSDKSVSSITLDKTQNTKSSTTKKSESTERLKSSISDTNKELSPIEDDKSLKKGKSTLSKKKGVKTIDQILKSLTSYPSTEEKLHQLCKKHLEVLEELRLVEPRIKQLERQVLTQQREKESLQAEYNRMILAKSRLESLCREMQRQSKVVKEESLIRIKEEEEKRKEVANKFQSTLNDISGLMQENSKRNSVLREENAELSQKLKMLVDNYSVWEDNMKKIVQQKELEAQLANAKHAKVNLELKQETEKFLREKQSLLENMSELQKKCTLLTANELQLRTELGDYTNKYEEFQSVLTNSSKVFANFKADMDSTSKKIKKLEKETNLYKQKWESSNKALLDMINNKEKQDKEYANSQQRILTLEKLCRALQTERNELRNQLNAFTPSPMCANEQTVPSTSSNDVEVPSSS